MTHPVQFEVGCTRESDSKTVTIFKCGTRSIEKSTSSYNVGPGMTISVYGLNLMLCKHGMEEDLCLNTPVMQCTDGRMPEPPSFETVRQLFDVDPRTDCQTRTLTH